MSAPITAADLAAGFAAVCEIERRWTFGGGELVDFSSYFMRFGEIPRPSADPRLLAAVDALRRGEKVRRPERCPLLDGGRP